jgi:hypothetical protein
MAAGMVQAPIAVTAEEKMNCRRFRAAVEGVEISLDMVLFI